MSDQPQPHHVDGDRLHGLTDHQITEAVRAAALSPGALEHVLDDMEPCQQAVLGFTAQVLADDCRRHALTQLIAAGMTRRLITDIEGELP